MKCLYGALMVAAATISSPIMAQDGWGKAVEIASSDQPEFMNSGSVYVAQCYHRSNSSNAEIEVLCSAYTAAIAAAINALDSTMFDDNGGSQINGPFACVPSSIPEDMLIETVANYIQMHRELRDARTEDLMAAAWREKFPCRSKGVQ